MSNVFRQRSAREVDNDCGDDDEDDDVDDDADDADDINRVGEQKIYIQSFLPRDEDGQWLMANGRWPMADGQWPMANGQWPMMDFSQ